MRRSAPLDFIAGAGGGHEGCGILLSRGTKVAIQPSMSRTGGSLLVPLALLLVITVLLYFHWGLRGQVSSFHVEREELREKLTTVQQERDAMAAQVHRFTEQLNLASQEKRGDDDQKKALSAKLDEAQVNIKAINVRLLAAQEAQRTAEEKLAGKEDELDHATTELEDQKNRYDQCQSSLSDKNKELTTLTDHYHGQLITVQHQLAEIQQDKATLAGQLSEQGDKLQAVEKELHNCQQGRVQAAGRDSWEGQVLEGGRANMRRGGHISQSDLDPMRRLRQQRMAHGQQQLPQEQQRMAQRRLPDDIHLHQPADSRLHITPEQGKSLQQPIHAAPDNHDSQRSPDEQTPIPDHPNKFSELQTGPSDHQPAAAHAGNAAEQKDSNAGAAQYSELEQGGDLANDGHLDHAADDHYGHDGMFAKTVRQHPPRHKQPGDQDGEDLVGEGGLQQQGQDEDRDSDEEEAKAGEKQHRGREEAAMNAPNVEQQDKEHKRSDAL